MCKKIMCMNIWLLFMFVCSSLWLLCICIWRCHREVFRFLRAGVICGCEQPSMGSGNCTIVLGRAIGTQLWAIFSVSISLHSLCLQNGNKTISSLFVRVWEKKCAFVSLLATQLRNESENTTTEWLGIICNINFWHKLILNVSMWIVTSDKGS